MNGEVREAVLSRPHSPGQARREVDKAVHAELDLSITGTEDARADEDDDDHIDVIGDVFADRCTGFEMHKIRVELRGIRQRPLDAVSDRRRDSYGEVNGGRSNLSQLMTPGLRSSGAVA